MIIERRKFLTGLVLAIAAPAIVKPYNIMPVKLFNSYLAMNELIDYNLNDVLLTLRLEILYDYMQIRPQWALVVADKI